MPGKNISPFYNWLSLAGFIVSTNSLILILALYIYSVVSTSTTTDLELYIYIILPVFLVLGLILVPLGVTLKIRWLKARFKNKDVFPVLNLNKRPDRTQIVKIILISLVFLAVSTMGSYRAYQYTNSVEFCTKVCHKVEEPAFITYQHSAHARVACVECHVGKGNGWSVKSKFSGLYQVYSTLFNRYSRPIASPIHSLRPQRETCENCHWPEKLYFRKLLVKHYYQSDSENTEWNLSLLMKMGPEFRTKGNSEGIHWHMNKDFKIEYVSDSRNRGSIPWVRLTNKETGEVKIFRDDKNKLAKTDLDFLEVRTMDCMDCHNRASHLYRSASAYIDNAFASGLIANDIPFFKKAALVSLEKPFSDKASAMKKIKEAMLSFYKSNHPEVLLKNSHRIEQAIITLQGEYNLNAFPFMRSDASKFPDYNGHLESEGCFRCHSGRHKTSTGETIPNNCELCHTIIAQGLKGNVAMACLNSSLKFVHPTTIDEKWTTKSCSECHSISHK